LPASAGLSGPEGSDHVEPDLDADGIGDVINAVGVTGDDRSLVSDGCRHDNRVNDVRRAGHATSDSGSTASPLVIGDNVASLEDPRDLVLRSATPCLCQDYDWQHRPDPSRGQFVVEREEIRIPALCGN
jgi:hypothetical protein